MKVSIFISDIGFEVPDAFLVGYALDYNEYFRDLSVSNAKTDLQIKLCSSLGYFNCMKLHNVLFCIYSKVGISVSDFDCRKKATIQT